MSWQLPTNIGASRLPSKLRFKDRPHKRDKDMLKENLNTKSKNRNGQSVIQTHALQASVRDCPACPREKNSRKRNGQQVIEYGVLIAALTTALLVMYVYTKRGLQAVIKDSADQIGSQADNEPEVSSIMTTGNSMLVTWENETTHVQARGDNRFYNISEVTASQGNGIVVKEIY